MKDFELFGRSMEQFTLLWFSESTGSESMRLLDSHCHTCKLLAGLSMQRGREGVVNRDET